MTCKEIISLFLFWGILTLNPLAGQDIKIQKLPISSPETDEFAPVVHDSTLYFVSNRRASLLVTYFNQNHEILYGIFNAPLRHDNTTGRANPVSGTKLLSLDAGPITFSNKGTMIIAAQPSEQLRFYRKKRHRTAPLVLYNIEKVGVDWQKVEKLQIEKSGDISLGHPALSPDGKQLYFVAEMEDGYGATDIYVSQKVNNRWSQPQNIGPKVNTPGRELFPFIHPSGKLYFTSDGHKGIGNFDIYYIDLSNPNSDPVLLPAPINTSFNDFSCYIKQDNNHGFFASDRDGSDDIYAFSIPPFTCSELQKIEEDQFCFTFFENGPFKSDTLPYIYRWDFGDGHEAEGLEVDHCFPGPGQYHIQLNVIDTLLNEELFSVASYNLSLEPKKQIWFQAPDTIEIGQTLNLKASIQGFNPTHENTFFRWDFGTGDISIGAKISYKYQKPGRYKIICSTLIENKTVCFYQEIEVIDPQ